MRVPLLLAITLTASLVSCAGTGPLPDDTFAVERIAGFDSWLLSVTPNGRSFGFYLYLPEDYDESASYPMVVYLQGWGNFGREPNPALLSSGPLSPLYHAGMLDPARRGQLDSRIRASIVVAPRLPFYDPSYQNPQGYYDPDTLDSVVRFVMTNYRADASRLYITGLSEGGGGTWAYAWRHTEKVAAIVPICAWLAYPMKDELKILPVWNLQCFDDPVVPHAVGGDATLQKVTGVANVLQGYPANSNNYTISYSAETGLGNWTLGVGPPTGTYTYTLYATGGHDAWTRTYANPDVWAWLFGQSKPQ